MRRFMLEPAIHGAMSVNVTELQHNLNEMGNAVEYAVRSACCAFVNADHARAYAVIENDRVINAMEIDIEKSIVRCFAIDHPVDLDLRHLLAIQKITTALERIGDHAVNIAETVAPFWATTVNRTILEIEAMAEKVQVMLADALTSFYDGAAEIATEVLVQDDMIDTLNLNNRTEVKLLVMGNNESFESGMELLRTSQNLERIADLATNIAEETIFFVKDRIVKHHAGMELKPAHA